MAHGAKNMMQSYQQAGRQLSLSLLSLTYHNRVVIRPFKETQMTKIKVFTKGDAGGEGGESIEKEVNQFLTEIESKNGEIISVTPSITHEPQFYRAFCVVVVYKIN